MFRLPLTPEHISILISAGHFGRRSTGATRRAPMSSPEQEPTPFSILLKAPVVCRLFERRAPRPSPDFAELAERRARSWTHPVGPARKAEEYHFTMAQFSSRVIPNFIIQQRSTRARASAAQATSSRTKPKAPRADSTAPATGDGRRRPQHQRLAVLPDRRAHSWLTGERAPSLAKWSKAGGGSRRWSRPAQSAGQADEDVVDPVES